MKRIFCLVVLLGLCACDRKTSSAELQCYFPSDWQTPVTDVLPAHRIPNEKVNVKIETFETHARVTVNEETAIFDKVSDEKSRGDFGDVDLKYSGVFPGTSRQVTLNVYGDISRRVIFQYDLTFADEKTMHNDKVFNVSHSCYPVREDYKGKMWSAKVPFKHHYAMPNKTQRCINEIMDRVECNDLVACTGLYLYLPENTEPHHITLTAEQAAAITPNWDYADIKLYENDGPMQDYEKDACDVLKRLNEFIESNGWDGTSMYSSR